MVEDFFSALCIVFYETICCKMFLNIFLGMRSKNKYIDTVQIGLQMVAYMIIALWTGRPYVVRAIVTIGVVFLIAQIFYKGKLYIKMLVSSLYYTLMISVDLVGVLIINCYIGDYGHGDVSKIVQVMLALVCKSVFFMLIILIEKIWKRREDVNIVQNVEWWFMIGFSVITIAIILLMSFSLQLEKVYVIYLPISFGIVFINLIFMFLIRYIVRREQRLFELRVIEGKNRMQLREYHENNINYENQKRMLHDYSNQLTCIQGLIKEGKYPEAKKYAESLNNKFLEGMDVIDVNNTIINIILNQKYRQAKARKINILFQVNDLSDVWLEEQDMIILLSNLLDNAIEACEKVNGDRIIKFKMIKEKQQLVISVQNSINIIYQNKDGEVQTNKKEKERHGIGLKNIQSITEFYHGMGKYHFDESNFFYTILFPSE